MKTDRDPAGRGSAQFKAELHEMVEEHKSWTSIIVWVPFNEGWGEWDRDETGRIADSVKAQDPTPARQRAQRRELLRLQGRLRPRRHDRPPRLPRPGDADARPATRVAVDGEHGGFGLKVDGPHVVRRRLRVRDDAGQGHADQPVRREPARRAASRRNSAASAARSTPRSPTSRTRSTASSPTTGRSRRWTSPRSARSTSRSSRGADGTGSGGPNPPPGTPGADGIHFYPFDGTGTKMPSATNDATLQDGATFAPGKNGQARCPERHPTSSSTPAPQLVDTSGNYTATAWVKLDKADGGFQTVVSQDGDRDSAFFLQYSGAGPAVRDELRRRPRRSRRRSRTRVSGTT